MNYAMEHPIAIRAAESERAGFIRRTYAHLAGAVLAFVCLEWVLFSVLDAEQVMRTLFGSTAALVVMLGAFIGIGFLARYWAHSDVSRGLQYAGLALYVVFEAIIFMPILWIASTQFPGQHLIEQAGVLTLAVFGGLTVSVFITRKDYSHLGPILSMGMFIMLGVFIACIFFPPSQGFFGLVVPLIMIVLLSGYILYDTSNVIHHFRTDQHVAAALELFADVALMFWYILRIMIYISGSRE